MCMIKCCCAPTAVVPWLSYAREPAPPQPACPPTPLLPATTQAAGYDLGELPAPSQEPGADPAGHLQGLGDALLCALRAQEDPAALGRGAAGITAAGAPADAAAWGAEAAPAEIPPASLTQALRFPADWGPTEWGPLPYLPDDDVLVRKLEGQWGSLLSYRGIGSTAAGGLLVPGVALGKLWIGLQPLLGIEGDPMRLLFQRVRMGVEQGQQGQQGQLGQLGQLGQQGQQGQQGHARSLQLRVQLMPCMCVQRISCHRFLQYLLSMLSVLSPRLKLSTPVCTQDLTPHPQYVAAYLWLAQVCVGGGGAGASSARWGGV